MKRLHKNAEMGMGTLIIFIAMVLVAAVAASVLLQTTGSLQNKALQTGKLTTGEVGTSINTLEIYAEDASDQSVDFFYQVVKLTSGSNAMRFENSLLVMNTKNVSEDYQYNSSIDCTNTSTMESSDAGYGVAYSIEGTNYMSGYLNRGDVAKLCYRSMRSIIEDESIKISFIPKVGTAAVVDLSVPELMVDKRIYVYP